jgi:hypothetical protein
VYIVYSQSNQPTPMSVVSESSPIKDNYTIVFVVISSNDLPVYTRMREISRAQYRHFPGSVRHFFVETRDDITETTEIGDLILVPGTESAIDGIHRKTMQAIEYISRKYDYEYMVRTNLSTLWNMRSALDLVMKVPKTRYAGGFMTDGFVSGTGIIMSRDVAEELAATDAPNSMTTPDDLVISRSIEDMGVRLRHITRYNCGRCPDDMSWFNFPNQRMVVVDDTDLVDILNFRVKHPDDRTRDVYYLEKYSKNLMFCEQLMQQRICGINRAGY